MTYDWPSRDEWARNRRTVYADDVDKVVEAVSADPAVYATPAEIAQAAAELGDYWRSLGRQVRDANRDAVAVFPLHGSRNRKRAAVLAFARERDRLSDEDKAVVEHAEALKHHRQLVNSAVDQLVGADGRAWLHAWTVDNAERWMPAGTCPTWRAIVARWKAACDRAADEYRAQVAQRPVDDAAWNGELRRRADIEQRRGVRVVPTAPDRGRPARFAQKPAGLTDAEYRDLLRLDQLAAQCLAKARQQP